MEPAGCDDDFFEAFRRVRVPQEPSGVAPAEELDASAEPDARHETERLGIAIQVVEDVVGRRVDKVGVMFEVAEGREDATGVGVHRRPHTTEVRVPAPLAAQHRSLLEDRRRESL